ncbi:MAG TPA: transporter substrate-binding domain-containing protein [Vicinamibacterales bacterium]|nr:transporter substrate-binding domain-containing protein [Vicinamibacterales bacterium]
MAAQTSQLKLVSTAWPPFTNAARQPRFALDLVETALGRIGVSSKTAIVSAPQFTPSLLSGLFDGSAAAWKDPERERELIFSQPYLENRLVLVGRHGTDVSAKTLPDLKGKRVAIVEGYSYGETVDSTGPVWVRSRSEEDSLTQLLKSGVDYTLMDELVVHYIVSNYPKESDTKLEIGSTPLLTRPLHFVIKRTRADAMSIIERFDAQLRGMIADRTYHRLLHVDWILADVDGDGVPELVPRTDQAGTSEPLHVYSLFSPPSPSAETPVKPGFYVGGNVYADWASVPENYKVSNSDKPDPRRSTGTIFRFIW